MRCAAQPALRNRSGKRLSDPPKLAALSSATGVKVYGGVEPVLLPPIRTGRMNGMALQK